MVVLSFQTMLPEGEPARFGDVRRRERTDSTNREVLDLARAGAPEGVVVVADHQSAGRGRRGRAWVAPPGTALMASVLLRPVMDPGSAHLAVACVALAAAEACEEVAGVRPALKWPNDLVVDDDDAGGSGKLAGILAETLVDGSRLDAVVVGMGLNLVRSPAPPAGAVFLEDLAGGAVDREQLLRAWLDRLDRRYPSLAGPAGRRALVDDYRRCCATLGRRVRVALDEGTLEGRAVGLTGAGHLVVETAGGRHQVGAGDVVHLRTVAPEPPGR
ncbi:MAG: biotin--[acetyl-CoA-carboxylase] ligase [Actinobacteria bacterium]|nr:biotin--[acetyl-CoA-carboxylase] ligase [Actinomycetota bacterium]